MGNFKGKHKNIEQFKHTETGIDSIEENIQNWLHI